MTGRTGQLSQGSSDFVTLDGCADTGDSEAAQRRTDISLVARGRSRLALNMLANTANVAVNIFVGIWFTRYLIHRLGVSAYGLVPLVSQVVSYFAPLTFSLNSSVGRYLTISLEKGDLEEANGYFNTCLFGSLLVSAVLLVPGVLLALHPDAVLDIPPGHVTATRWLAAGTIAAFFIGLIVSPFEVASFCRNRFDLRNLVSASSLIVRVVVVVFMFSVLGASLSGVGAGVLLGAMTGAGVAVIVWSRLMPMLTLDIRRFSLRTLRSLASTAAWIAINQVGSLLYLNIDLVIVNRLSGPKSGGSYAAVLQWSILLRALSVALAGVFAPTMLALYAANDMPGLIRCSRSAVRINGLLMGLPIALICGLSKPLLHVWLGPEFSKYAALMILVTFHLSINLGVMPLFSIQVATNCVKWPGIVTCLMGLANLGLALVLAGPAGWGMYGVASAGAIMLTAKNAIFTPFYAARIIGAPMRTFQTESLLIFAITSVFTVVCWVASNRLDIASWSALAAIALLVSAGYAIVVYFFALSDSERGVIKRMLRLDRSTCTNA